MSVVIFFHSFFVRFGKSEGPPGVHLRPPECHFCLIGGLGTRLGVVLATTCNFGTIFSKC